MSITTTNGAIFAPPPPPFTAANVEQNNLPETTQLHSPTSTDNNDLSPSLVITVLVLATAIIVSASIYLLLKVIHHRSGSRTPSSSTSSSSSITATTPAPPGHRRVVPEKQQGSVSDSLPLFTYASLASSNNNNNNNAEADCAVCLSKFEREDQLRLLPACCHAFHAECIDAWLVTNQTCPLCRSSIFVSEASIMSKIGMSTSDTAAAAAGGGNTNNNSSRSFRVEIGSVSRRRLPSDFSGRSYSIGSFEYVLDDVEVEVPEVAVVGRSRRRSSGEYVVVELDKQNQQQQQQQSSEIQAGGGGGGGESLASEVGGVGRGGSWLKDYVDRLAWAASSSLRSSGRFFGSMSTGSSRRTEASRGIHDLDLEANRLGDDIGEMFRWLSGV